MKDVPYVSALLAIRKATDEVANKDHNLKQLGCSLYSAAVQEVLGFPRAHGKYVSNTEAYHFWNIDKSRNIIVDIGYDRVTHDTVPINIASLEDPHYKLQFIYTGKPNEIDDVLEEIKRKVNS